MFHQIAADPERQEGHFHAQRLHGVDTVLDHAIDPFALGKGKLKAATIILPASVSDGMLTIDFA